MGVNADISVSFTIGRNICGWLSEPIHYLESCVFNAVADPVCAYGAIGTDICRFFIFVSQ